MHQHSLLSWYELQKTGVYDTRREQVMKVIEYKGAMTDRDVKEYMGFKDMNSVRPAITSLVQDGSLYEVGKVEDDETGRQVRIVDVRR